MLHGLCRLFVSILFIYSSIHAAAKQSGNSNTYLMQYTGSQEDAITLGKQLDLTFVKPVFDEDDDWYLFTKTNLGSQESGEYESLSISLKDARKLDKKVKSLTQEQYLERYKRAVTVNDAQWSNQWQLQTSQTPSHNVYESWDKGYTGSGVIISIVDDGIDKDHSDLAANYEKAYSYDFLNDMANPSYKANGDGHGTNCAGVAAAAKNTDCVIGVAYNATLSAVRILGERGATASEEASALTYGLSNVDIYSNSWGPSDNGKSFTDMSSVQRAALKKGVTKGRGGLGAIYTWASGNGGWNYDDCNADGYSKSIYTIAVAAVSETTAPTWYSEHCSAILTATYSGDDPNAMITTTGASDTCENDFSGTSSACPLASGIIALTLEANSSLSWRDIQHLIVETSISSGLHANASFSTNAAGKEFSHYFGFGLMDAEAMVDAAPTWQGVPEYTTCKYPTLVENWYSFSTTISTNYTVTDCFIEYIEFVEVRIHFKGYYRGDVSFDLTSPLGTTSTIFSQRKYDFNGFNEDVKWTFMSVHFWGENPNGTWALDMIDMSSTADTSMKLISWSLKFHGTITDPLSGPPSAGSIGGACVDSNDCSSILAGGCLYYGHVCVNCTGNYQVHNKYCVQDGYRYGYCSKWVPCLFTYVDECVDHICKEKEEIEEDSVNVGLIIGLVVLGLVVVAVLAVAGFFIYKKFIKPKGKVAPAANNPPARPYVGDQPTSTHFQPSLYETSYSKKDALPPLRPDGYGQSNPAV